MKLPFAPPFRLDRTIAVLQRLPSNPVVLFVRGMARAGAAPC